MSSGIVSPCIKVVSIADANVLTLKRITSDDKSQLNGNRIIELDLSANTNIDVILQELRASLYSLISLNLSQCNLSYIPDPFKDLRINELNLSHNSFMEVPGCIISGLKFLHRLDLSHNQLTHFPEPLCLKKLRVLHVNNNKLLNIPEWILNVDAFNLEELDYSFNDLTTLNRSQFHKVPTYELKNLTLKNCCVRNSDVSYLKNIKTLKMMDLSNESDKRLCNSLTDCDELFNKPRWDDRLKVLSLNFLGISDLPDEIGLLVALEELFLKKNELLWLPDSIVSLKKLRLLDLTYNKLVCLPYDFSKMQSLQILNLAHNALSSFMNPHPLCLVKLDLYDNLLESYTDLNFCDIKADLELNYLDTSRLNEKYKKSKELLRAGIGESRCDGSKKFDNADSPSESSSDSELDESDGREYSGQNCEERFEEYWSSDSSADLCKNGCSLSDNEWTGQEEQPVVKIKKNLVRRCPSWIFEDV